MNPAQQLADGLLALGLAVAALAVLALLVQGVLRVVDGEASPGLHLALIGSAVGIAATALGALPALVLRTLPQRLEDSLSHIEQGDLQVQIRAGETDRLLRRLALSQQSAGQSVLLGALAVAAMLRQGQDERRSGAGAGT